MCVCQLQDRGEASHGKHYAKQHGESRTSDAGWGNLQGGLTRRGMRRTFGEFTKLFLHVRHRIPLRQRLLLLLLLLCRITAMDRRVRALRIRELAHLLLLLLPLLSQRNLVAGKLLLILEQQLTRKLLVQLGLCGL